MAQQNRELVRLINEEIHNQGRIHEAIQQWFAPEFVNHSAPPGLPPTREGNEVFSTMFRGAFPDYRVTIHDVIVEGDKVVTRKTFTGTHRGDWMGIPASGRRVSFGAIDIVRIDGGKVVEHWAQFDMLTLAQQIGALPAAAPDGSATSHA
jgi:predicted SnoaL-like aldol condensation-catalyzing enzyme